MSRHGMMFIAVLLVSFFVREAVEAADGRDRGVLCVLDRESGELLKTVELPCVPQLDGMLVSGDRIVITGKIELVVLGKEQ